ncbi:hypothetical protein PF002_g16450 [Phytophthora fragariae]|uniref:peptidyl-tRNA hydrolase n=1 Tax=Phytophthora fragariae TaxID=53985 RepID=A0A6A3YK01_9STRA|nr:hypothetical protein PF002_g16450 [Phytophthora fragariae]
MFAGTLLAAIAFAGAEAVSTPRFRSSDISPRRLPSAHNVKHILHFSDVHLNISESLNATESAEMQFEYGDDAPIALLTSALEFAKVLMPNPDFFLYTGDHVVHGDLTDEFLAETVETNVETLVHYYATADNDTNLDITALIGNSDTSPDYKMNVTDPTTEVNPSISLISAAWQDTLSKSNLDWFNHRGYLTYDLDDKLVVLTLNTVPYSPSHTPNTTNMSDPFGQFAWLNETLVELRRADKFAYIVGHIPPIIDSFSGAQMWEAAYIATYKAIVSDFADIIKAQFFAHVHSIEFRVPLSSEQQAQEAANGTELVPLFISAAISPIYDNNPAFMVWDFDATTYELLDFTVYGTNISSDSQELHWQPLFKASSAYNVSSLRTSELNAFVDRAASDPALLEQYYYNSKAQSYLQSPCQDVACQSKWLCTTQWYTKSEIIEASPYKIRLADMDDVAWKCTAAFVLGAAAHYFISSQLLSDVKSSSNSSSNAESKSSETAVESRSEASSRSSSGSSEDWEGEDSASWVPHKMVMCVRTDLKMGKGKIAAQCCHATLGAYKRASKRTPDAVRAWEMLGQAKVCLKVDSEEEMLALAERAAEHGLVNYVVVDAGRTQIAPDSKTVLSIGPAPLKAIDEITGHLKLM